jgi:hypothetical protein
MQNELRPTGALTVFESEAGYRSDLIELACKRSLGIELHDLTQTEAREMEPALGPRVVRAVCASMVTRQRPQNHSRRNSAVASPAGALHDPTERRNFRRPTIDFCRAKIRCHPIGLWSAYWRCRGIWWP